MTGLIKEASLFLDDLWVAAAIIAAMAVIHAAALDRLKAIVDFVVPKMSHRALSKHFWQVGITITTIMGIFFSHTIQIWCWAFVYRMLALPEFSTMEDAVYFSTVTYTTLGYGDLVLKDDWRVLSGIEAANGIVFFGWSTAFLFEVMTLIYPRKVRQG